MLAHPGAGGTIAWADLDRRLGAAICHNRMFGNSVEHSFDYPFAELVAAIDGFCVDKSG